MIAGVEVRVGRKGEGEKQLGGEGEGVLYLQFRRPRGGMSPPTKSDKGRGSKFPDFARRH